MRKSTDLKSLKDLGIDILDPELAQILEEIGIQKVVAEVRKRDFTVIRSTMGTDLAYRAAATSFWKEISGKEFKTEYSFQLYNRLRAALEFAGFMNDALCRDFYIMCIYFGSLYGVFDSIRMEDTESFNRSYEEYSGFGDEELAKIFKTIEDGLTPTQAGMAKFEIKNWRPYQRLATKIETQECFLNNYVLTEEEQNLLMLAHKNSWKLTFPLL